MPRVDIEAWQQRLRDFAAARHWQPFHTPKNLAMALMVEAAELQEHFQWLTPEGSQRLCDDPAQRQAVGEEVADVLLYLLQLADHCGIDIAQALEHKFAQNALKHPLPGPPAGQPASGPHQPSA